MKIKPIGKRVIAIPDSQKDKTAAGILLVASAQEKPEIFTIAVVSDEANADGFNVGDRIIAQHYAGTEIAANKEKYSIIETRDIIAKVTENEK